MGILGMSKTDTMIIITFFSNIANSKINNFSSLVQDLMKFVQKPTLTRCLHHGRAEII